MKYNPDKHHRRSIRLRGYDYNRTGAYFVTVCVRGRECLFGDVVDGEMRLNEHGRIVNETLEWLAKQYIFITLDIHAIMPNHLHVIINVHNDRGRGGSRTAPTGKSLGRLIGAFKTVSTKRINEIRDTPGWPVWQRNYYEHVIRNDDSLGRIRQYTADNPLRWAFDRENPDAVEQDALDEWV